MNVRLLRGSLSLLVATGLAVVAACSPAASPAVDQDGDGWPEGLDCDDTDEEVFPAADETPGDGIDQDCSGSDESIGAGGMGGNCENCASGGQQQQSGGSPGSGGLGGAPVAFVDEDGDGFGLGWGDCDDTNKSVHPGAPEVLGDGIDQNCDGSDRLDADGDGFTDDDCDPTRGDVFPGAVELVLNGIDENCDGSDLVGGFEVSALSGDAVAGEGPAIAVLGDPGSEALLLAWADSRVTLRQDLFGQVVSLHGTPLGPEIPIDVLDNNAKSHVHLVRGNDGFLVVWVTAEAVWAQRLDSQGELLGVPLGMGAAGTVFPAVAYLAADGGRYGVAFTDPVGAFGQQCFFRVMAMDGTRGEIIPFGGAETSCNRPAVVALGNQFVAVWEGAGDTPDTYGIYGQTFASDGAALSSPVHVLTGPLNEPILETHGGQLVLTYRQSGNLGSAVGVGPAPSLAQLSAVPSLRLSLESPYQSGFHLVSTGDHLLSLWQDERHSAKQPPASAVYGQLWQPGDGGASSQGESVPAARLWGADRALAAGDPSLALRGVAVIDEFAYLPTVLGERVSLQAIRLSP
jgi:Putative metal-binding motif